MNNQLLEEITAEYLQEKRDHLALRSEGSCSCSRRWERADSIFGGIVIARKGSESQKPLRFVE